MSNIDLVISILSLLTAGASAFAAWKASISARNANALAKEMLTKRAQSELYLKALQELASLYCLMADWISQGFAMDDGDFLNLFNIDGSAALELVFLLNKLEVLSEAYRFSLKKDPTISPFLERLISPDPVLSKDDLGILQRLISLLQDCQRKELSL